MTHSITTLSHLNLKNLSKVLLFVAIVSLIFYMTYTLRAPINNPYENVNLNAFDESFLHLHNETNNGDDAINKLAENINSINNTSSDEEYYDAADSESDMKYILQWSSGKKSPFYLMRQGQESFFKFNCPYTNCYVTDNKTLLESLKDYDAIVFNGNYVINMEQKDFPQERSPTQKYVFSGTEPAAMKRACKPVLDNFFNWTWTYRIDSDFRWGYITVYDLNGTVVGPKLNMEWPEQMEVIDEDTKKILDNKTKAAAWFVSRCKSLSHREDVANKISEELEKFDLSVDIYGCGNFTCPRSSNKDKCFIMLQSDYYFYFSFENSFSVDYVSEKLLTALQNYAVPVVLGGADYSRFLPPGSYLNAGELDAKQLAVTMHDIMSNKTRYYDFFRWRNYFKYKETTDSEDVCNICTALNDRERVKTNCAHEHFREWWNDEWHRLCKKKEIDLNNIVCYCMLCMFVLVHILYERNKINDKKTYAAT